MLISIHIEGATVEVLKALASIGKTKTIRSAATQATEEKQKKIRWSRKARKNLRIRTPEAPYGLKKDGTPRAKPGAPKKEAQ